MKKGRLMVAGLGLALAGHAAAQARYRIEPVAPFAGGAQVNALRVNAFGSVMVQGLGSGGTGWWNGEASSQAATLAQGFTAVGIADDESLVGYDSSAFAASYRLTRSGSSTAITYGNGPAQNLQAVAPSGLAAGTQFVAGGLRGAYRAPGNEATFIAPITNPDVRVEFVTDANSAGVVIGMSFQNQTLDTAWIARGGQAERLDKGGFARSAAFDVDSRGRVLGARGTAQTDAYTLWNEAGVPGGLSMPAGIRATQMVRMNASDGIIGAFVPTAGGSQYAGLYENGTVTRWQDLIDMTQAGWVSLQFNDLSDSGYIVGVGTLNGVQRGFRMTPLNPVPEPGILAGLGLGVLAVLRRRRVSRS